MPAEWSPLVLAEPPDAPEALQSVLGLLARMVDAYNARTVARMLDVHPAMVARWRAGVPISRTMAMRIIDLHDVLTRALQVFSPQTAASWLVGSEPLLAGARPIDVLAIQGVVPVIEALAGIDGGTYA